MSNNIEEFISGNRDGFDDRSPSAKAWKNIEASMTGKNQPKRSLRPIINWVLAAAAVLAIGIFIYIRYSRKEARLPETARTETIDQSLPGAPEVNAFAKLINMKQEELKLLAKEQPRLYEKFTTDMTQLDSTYAVLKAQLVSSPNKELLIEAMIQNLQLQLNVLNQQLNIINEIKQSKKYSHEKKDQFI